MKKIAWSVLKSCLKTSLAQAVVSGMEGTVPKIHDLLRDMASGNKSLNKGGLSYIVTSDKDFDKAAEVIDMNKDSQWSASAPYEFTLYDDKGRSSKYRFAIYKLVFRPSEEPEAVIDSVADVKGNVIDVKKDEIAKMLAQGKGDKFVAGVENTEDVNERFNYDMLGAAPPESKKAFVIDYDSDTKQIKETNQMNAIQGDYQNYVSDLKTKVEIYNQKISDKLNQEHPPATPAVPEGGMPPMGGAPAPGGMPPMPI